MDRIIGDLHYEEFMMRYPIHSSLIFQIYIILSVSYLPFTVGKAAHLLLTNNESALFLGSSHKEFGVDSGGDLHVICGL